MAELLLELFSEEIPARMQAQAAADLQRLMTAKLAAAGLAYASARAFATPRRLALVVEGLPLAQPDLREERKGPRADAPEQAVAGFLKSAGIAREQAEVRRTDKGEFLFAVIARKGRPTAEVIAEIAPDLIRGFPWPKSMRWGSGSLRWVRPLQSIVCLLDGRVVPFSVDGIDAGDRTEGHRFMGAGAFSVSSFADYREKLEKAHVILDPGARKRIIVEKAAKLAAAKGFEVIEDDALAAENAGLTEWPEVLLGAFDEAFLDVPPEVLTATMRTNQKYFSLRDPKSGRLAPSFVIVANRTTADRGAAIIGGNQRVLRARLSDAKFFWDQDLKLRLEDRAPKLADIVYHEKLGSLAARMERIEALAVELGKKIPGANEADIRRAARLAKCDLVAGMVFEFPEVQGVMGAYYAERQGESAAVASAIREHYSPKGPDDSCPSAPVSVALALAEKLDSLAGFFGIEERPTGSKDPYALRRAALGVIRLIVENGLRMRLGPVFSAARDLYAGQGKTPAEIVEPLLSFFADRLKVQQREGGVRHDLIDAVFSLGDEDDLVRLLARVAALSAFVASEDGGNLLTGYRRAANIVRIEEKKDDRAYAGPVDAAGLEAPEEKALFEKLGAARGELDAAIAVQDFADAMAALARLRKPVDAFFDSVTVNADSPSLRENRLNLLSEIRRVMHAVADFSKIEG